MAAGASGDAGSFGHQNGYQLGQLLGSVVSGLGVAELITPATPLFSPELVGSMTQPPQLDEVEDPAGLAVL